MEIFIEDIGKIVFKKSDRARRMSIRMKPFADITVTVPNNVTYDKAQQFVISKQNWIKKHLVTMSKQEQKMTIFTPDVSFKTCKHILKMEKWDINKISFRVENGIINVKYPQNIDATNERVQELTRKGIESALRIEAVEYLPVRIRYLSKKLGFKYRGVELNSLKTRWGACSRDNYISLNVHLMRLPSRLIDYVIIHELCHTKYKNHGLGFWRLMTKVLPDAKLLDKQMKNYNTKIY